MDALVALEIVVPVETLRALITLEWAIILLLRLTVRMSTVNAVMTTIATHHPADSAATDHLHLRARVVDVGHDGPGHCWQRITKWTRSIVMLRCWRRLQSWRLRRL